MEIPRIRITEYPPKYPCRNCIYFAACGENTRTAPCKGRVTKGEKKKEEQNGK